jgi:hypothetical protein
MPKDTKPGGKNSNTWPYPVNYGREKEIAFDVLVLGGGIAGCHAAINAAREGARLAIVEKVTCTLGELPYNYWLLPPHAPTYEENYERHSKLNGPYS